MLIVELALLAVRTSVTGLERVFRDPCKIFRAYASSASIKDEKRGKERMDGDLLSTRVGVPASFSELQANVDYGVIVEKFSTFCQKNLVH
jgi:hypothetical protein